MLRTALFWTLLLGTAATAMLVLWLHWNTSAPAEPAKQPGGPIISSRLVPADALRAYQRAEGEGISWQFLAALGHAESDHGRSPLPGVRSGINSAGCCAGPMQLCISDSCGNVASMYARDGDGDGSFSVYDIDDAVATAASYLRWMKNVVGTDEKLLAAGYNAGPTIVSREGIPPYPETQEYVRKTAEFMNKLERED